MNLLFLTGIILSAFLTILLFLKRGKTQGDLILTVWMAVMTIHQVLSFVHQQGLSDRYPHLLALAFPWPVLHGAFLFVYVRAMTREKPLRWNQVLPHFMPFVLLIILAMPFYLLSAEEKREVFRNEGAGFEWFDTIRHTLYIVLGFGYSIWSLILIQNHHRKISQWFSNTDKITLRWLAFLSIGLSVIWMLVLFYDDHVIFSAVTILVIFIGIFGINQLPLFFSHHTSRDQIREGEHSDFDEYIDPKELSEESTSRYAKSGLKENEAADLHQQLTKLMEDHEPFRRGDLTLADLANMLDVHPNYLSQVINEKEQKNFYLYINSLRIQAFLKAVSLPEKQHYSFLALAFDCGFNSKSTFNKYFKAYTGKSPSEYLAQ